MLLLIDNYDSFSHSLAQMFGTQGVDTRVERNDAIDLSSIAALAPERIVLGPGPCAPTEAGISMDVVREFAGKIPLLGIGLGHQVIAQVFGASLGKADKICVGKTSQVFHNERGLFRGVENPLSAVRYHATIVARKGLPDVLEVTAKTWGDEIMGIRHRGFGQACPVLGLQFHPESHMTPAGKDILENFLEMSRPRLAASA